MSMAKNKTLITSLWSRYPHISSIWAAINQSEVVTKKSLTCRPRDGKVGMLALQVIVANKGLWEIPTIVGFRGGCSRGGGNWGTLRIPREDWEP